jgi:hypothetical protein
LGPFRGRWRHSRKPGQASTLCSQTARGSCLLPARTWPLPALPSMPAIFSSLVASLLLREPPEMMSPQRRIPTCPKTTALFRFLAGRSNFTVNHALPSEGHTRKWCGPSSCLFCQPGRPKSGRSSYGILGAPMSALRPAFVSGLLPPLSVWPRSTRAHWRLF